MRQEEKRLKRAEDELLAQVDTLREERDSASLELERVKRELAHSRTVQQADKVAQGVVGSSPDWAQAHSRRPIHTCTARFTGT